MKIFEKILQQIAEAEKLLNKEETAGYFYLTYLRLAKQELEQAETTIKEFQRDAAKAINKYKQADENPGLIQVDFQIQHLVKQLPKLADLKAKINHKHKLHKILATKIAVDFFEFRLVKDEEKNPNYQKKLDDPEIIRNIFRAQINKLKLEGDLRDLRITARQLDILKDAITSLNSAKLYDDLLNEIEIHFTKINLLIDAADKAQNGYQTVHYHQKISPNNVTGTAAAPAVHKPIAATADSKQTPLWTALKEISKLTSQSKNLLTTTKDKSFVFNKSFLSLVHEFYTAVDFCITDNPLFAKIFKDLNQKYKRIKLSLKYINDHDDKNTALNTIKSHLNEINIELDKILDILHEEKSSYEIADDDKASTEASSTELADGDFDEEFNPQPTAATSPLGLNGSPYTDSRLKSPAVVAAAAPSNLGKTTDSQKPEPALPTPQKRVTPLSPAPFQLLMPSGSLYKKYWHLEDGMPEAAGLPANAAANCESPTVGSLNAANPHSHTPAADATGSDSSSGAEADDLDADSFPKSGLNKRKQPDDKSEAGAKPKPTKTASANIPIKFVEPLPPAPTPTGSYRAMGGPLPSSYNRFSSSPGNNVLSPKKSASKIVAVGAPPRP